MERHSGKGRHTRARQPLTARARRLRGCAGSGRKDGPRPNRRMRGLPTSASHVLWRTREAEAAYEPLCVSASPISFRSKRPVDCHNSNLASFYFAFVHHSTRANSTPAKPKPSLARQDTEKPRSRLLRRTEHKPLKSVIRNPGKRHQRPCSGS
jgi:hypothetical protein